MAVVGEGLRKMAKLEARKAREVPTEGDAWGERVARPAPRRLSGGDGSRAAMVAALDKTPPRDFDEVAMVAALGEAWADVKIDNSGGDDRRKRRGRRRQT